MFDILRPGLRALATGCALLLAAPAAASPVLDPSDPAIVSFEGYAEAHVSCASCGLFSPLQGLLGAQDGAGGDPIGTVRLDDAHATHFRLPNSGAKTEHGFLLDLLALSGLALEEEVRGWKDAVKEEGFGGGASESFDVAQGFFLVKWGGGGGGGVSHSAFFYAPVASEMTFFKGDLGGLSHVSQFGGVVDPFGSVVVAEAPLPAALPLLGAGLALLGVAARRRRA